jgi:hypothetical protein
MCVENGPAVYACSRTSPITVCDDARLEDGGSLLYPAGTASGQAGWDVGVNYANCEDLARQLDDVLSALGAVHRLGIDSHGFPGEFDIDGVLSRSQLVPEGRLGEVDPNTLSVPTFERFYGRLMPIARCVDQGATVLLMGCLAGAGDPGTALLKVLSESVFRGRKVVAFRTIGVSIRQYRKGEKCTNPGMRDTDNERPAPPGHEDERYPTDVLLKLPWASENSPNAKVMLNGKLLKDPDPSNAQNLENLFRNWFVEIGSWAGVFSFSRDGKVFWADNMGARRHYGRWHLSDGGISWQFDDDPDGWKRTFLIPNQWNGSVVNGQILPQGQGFFKMTDRS